MARQDKEVSSCYMGCLATSGRKIERTIARIYDDALRPLGVKATQVSLLVHVGLMGPVAAKDLVPAMSIDQTTLSRNLEKLEAGGLVAIDEGDDRRTRPVSLTPAGRKLLREVRPVWERTQDRVRELLGADVAETLVLAAERLGRGT
ncbi:MAG: MarR family winged helix-turn-helix transcriptional regulator [Planctomycetota bacterium]